MILIKLIRWLYKTLNGDQSPAAIALGFTLGLIFGLFPFGLVSVLGLVALLIVKCHFGSAIVAFGLGSALGALFLRDSLAQPIGMAVLEHGPHGLFLSLAGSDSFSLLRLHEAIPVGSLVIGLIIAVPLFIGVRAFIAWFRERFREKLGKSKTFRTLGNIWLFRVLRWVFVG